MNAPAPDEADVVRPAPARAPLLPSLKELCTRVVYNNLPSITSFGEMSYEAVHPFLMRMDAAQLRCVEENSPHLIDHTEEIWKALCLREFIEIRRAYDSGQLGEPGYWREVYDDAEAARELKFAQLQAKMKNNYKAIAHQKEAKQIKVIEKAPPAKRRAFSCASLPLPLPLPLRLLASCPSYHHTLPFSRTLSFFQPRRADHSQARRCCRRPGAPRQRTTGSSAPRPRPRPRPRPPSAGLAHRRRA
ncbi:hypothetical protein CALCODRAFT_496689 [Calocera cornea HHB12733]|uniref:Elongin-A n=1 Tax=Calocera cornea HHB12733 TaxID=1353952 RepID=A0A165FPG4_9BASI|nr:hypothetical protein CALCODRAFT_496689 [Calocera cornea HHB12733]